MSAVQAMQDFSHQPVMLREIVELAMQAQPRLIVDCTLGGAGHSAALLQALPHAQLLGLDRDLQALAAAQRVLQPFGDRVRLLHGQFSQIENWLEGEQAQFILADFGVSSHQLDKPERGFSFRFEAPLDMRMDPSQGEDAASLLASIDVVDLTEALRTLGEERHASRVARLLVEKKPKTTLALANSVRSVVRKSKDGIDPATRTFQALRMLVNQEHQEIEAWLRALPRVLAPGGVAVAISFHSIEDRAVKHAFRTEAQDCICPPRLPVCQCGHVATLELLTRSALRPQADECRSNPRAQSAKLRAARRRPT